MTGFASIQTDLLGASYRFEVKSLNHRYLDLKLRLPKELSSIEIPLRKLIQKRIRRGSVEFKIEKIRSLSGSDFEVSADLTLAANYFECLKSIQNTLGLEGKIKSHHIANFPDVIQKKSQVLMSNEEENALWNEIEPCVEATLEKLISMRQIEGDNLQQFFLNALSDLDSSLKKIENLRPEWEKVQSEKMKLKITKVFETYPIEDQTHVIESRLAQELALLLEKSDIQEEITRLNGHIQHFTQSLKNKDTHGRKLEFFLQELNREANTLGNKSQDLSIQNEIVKIKVGIEQMREQVLNIE
tara:strand:+ start:2877 stop:3776 length:900 start_codon:yes stop_codon:yes gene_type:complete